MGKPINKPVRGIRDSIPGGYVLGRTGAGSGPPILLPLSNFTSPGYVANTTIQVNGPAGGDLSGTYPNPTVAKIQGRAVKNQAPTDRQVLLWVNGSTDWEPGSVAIPAGGSTGQVLTKHSGTDYDVDWETSGGVLIGSGAPSGLQPAGTLYSRSDTAGLYVSQPTPIGGNPSVVQSGSNSGHSVPGSITLSGAPTPGNLILLWLGTDSDSHTVIDTTKWTLKTNGGATRFGLLAYRYAQIGDTAVLPAICTGGTRFWASEAVEINNVTGTFATDFDQLVEAYDLTGTPITTTSMNTVANNELGLAGTMHYNGSSGATISAPWTSDIAGLDAGNFGSFNISHQAFATSGSAVSATINNSGGVSDRTFYIVVLLKSSAGFAANWVKLAPLPPSLDRIIDRSVLNLTGSKA